MDVNLSPLGQQQFNSQEAIKQSLLNTAQTGLGAVAKSFQNPNIDTSLLPARPINAGQTAQDAILSRVQPQIEQDRGMLTQQLQNQGLMAGSQAWNDAWRKQSQSENDMRNAAALTGINAGEQARQQALSEAAYLQDRPLNVVNALRTGNQVSMPQQMNVPMQQTTAGPDLLGAVNSQYNAQLGQYNAQQANNPWGSLLSIGSAMAGFA